MFDLVPLGVQSSLTVYELHHKQAGLVIHASQVLSHISGIIDRQRRWLPGVQVTKKLYRISCWRNTQKRRFTICAYATSYSLAETGLL